MAKQGWLPRAMLVLFTLAPGLSFFGLWDHYPPWALHSGTGNDVRLYFSDTVYEKLPDAVQDYVTDEGPDRDGLNVGEWSYGEHTPRCGSSARYSAACAGMARSLS